MHSYSHDALADAILANPLLKQDDLAVMFGYTPSWISTIVRSDAFQALLERKRSQLSDPIIRQAIELRFQNMAARALQIIEQKLQKDPDEVSDKLALRAAELGAKVSGLGETNTRIIVNPDRISQLAERISKLNRVNGEVQDVDAKETTSPNASEAGTPALPVR